MNDTEIETIILKKLESLSDRQLNFDEQSSKEFIARAIASEVSKYMNQTIENIVCCSCDYIDS